MPMLLLHSTLSIIKHAIIGTSSIDCVQRSRFHPRTETVSSLLNVLLVKIRTMDIVTYSGFSIRDVTLLHSKSQYTLVKHSRQLSEHKYTSNLFGLGTHSYRILPTGPLVAIFNTHCHS
jgi:hypothetical protein